MNIEYSSADQPKEISSKWKETLTKQKKFQLEKNQDIYDAIMSMRNKLVEVENSEIQYQGTIAFHLRQFLKNNSDKNKNTFLTAFDIEIKQANDIQEQKALGQTKEFSADIDFQSDGPVFQQIISLNEKHYIDNLISLAYYALGKLSNNTPKKICTDSEYTQQMTNIFCAELGDTTAIEYLALVCLIEFFKEIGDRLEKTKTYYKEQKQFSEEKAKINTAALAARYKALFLTSIFEETDGIQISLNAIRDQIENIRAL